MDTRQEHNEFTYATDADWDRAAASEIGSANTTQAWVLTDRDVWHRNPYYQGPPVRHPEDDQDDNGPAVPNSEPELECPF